MLGAPRTDPDRPDLGIRLLPWVFDVKAHVGPRVKNARLGKPDIDKLRHGVVTFTHFTCQPRCALKDRNQENQSVKGLEVRANPSGNGLFLASVAIPNRFHRWATRRLWDRLDPRADPAQEMISHSKFIQRQLR